MKEKGFTLVELLAVIVVLAIIAVIAVPIIIGVIDKAKVGALKDSAYGIIDSANLYYAKKLGDVKDNVTFKIENGQQISQEKIDYKGKVENGIISLYTNGEVELCIDDGKTSVKKDAGSNTLITENKLCDGEIIDTGMSGTEPVVSGDLVPVIIEDNGTVKKADTNSKWYNYYEKKWANAVILVDNTNYNVGDTIPENKIQSYFVWIPRYRYRLWNTGTASKNAHSIEVVFESKETESSNGSNNGEWLTHPAFTTFNTNGFWVGKFETGYNGATSTTAAQVNSSDSSKIIVKPNVYSWRNNTVYNFFVSSYNYNRNLDSHMMKNTEWGAVAYLSHSKYGIGYEVNINNNSAYKTGYSALPSTNQQTYPGTYGDGATYNQAYNTEIGYLASTTGNITGVYDMSGGAYEYMAAYRANTLGSSGFNATTIATYNSKYFDVYNANSSVNSYQYRILGDATGEMGPFKSYLDGDNSSRWHNSWYADYSSFVDSSYPWFYRGGDYGDGVLAGQFYFARGSGGVYTYIGSRLVLAP